MRISTHPERRSVSYPARLFQEGLAAGVARGDIQSIVACGYCRYYGNNFPWMIDCQRCDVPVGCAVGQEDADSGVVSIRFDLDFFAFDDDLSAWGERAVGCAGRYVGNETDVCAAVAYTENFDADFFQRLAHLGGKRVVEGNPVRLGVVCRACPPVAKYAGSVVADAGLHVVSLLQFLAADAVGAIENVEQGFILQFGAALLDDAGDIGVVERPADGGDLGDVVIVHLFGQKIEF